MDNSHLINKNRTLLDALKQINTLYPDPLVLFVIDDENRMVGTLTDGDSRRALIAGAAVSDNAENVMHRNFNFMRADEANYVLELRHQKEMNMKLVPILDDEHHIVDIVNLEKFKTRLPVDAVIMAGGKGERLRPLTLTTPKPLLKVGDKCIIDYNVDALINYGLENISVTVNYLGEQLEEHYKERRQHVQVKCVREPKFLGTMGSVKFVDSFVNDTVLVMNSDLFTNIDYEDFYLHFLDNDADMSVAAVPYSVNVPYGIFELAGRDIQGVKEKPTYNYYANAGIYLIKKKLLDLVPDNVFYNATDFMEMLIAKNHKVIRYPLTGYWIDIGKPEDYQKAQELVKHL